MCWLLPTDSNPSLTEYQVVLHGEHDMRLQDRVAIVTGGGHGIGRAYALGLAGEGARLLVADLDHEAAAETARQIEAAGIGLTRTLARELGDANVCVNVLLPGSTLSEDEPTEEILRMRARPAQQRAFKRVQRPDDLVGTMLFLCSDDSDFITGQSLV